MNHIDRAMRLLRRGALPACCAGLAACSPLQPQDFSAVQPQFQPDRFFEGHVHAWGVMEDGDGNPKSRFDSIDIGTRDGDGVRIDQTIHFSDGTTQHRSWRLRRVDEHHYEGTAADIVGTASGEAYGNAFHLEYTVELKPGNVLSHVGFSQWLYLQDDGQTVLSRSSISKLGLTVARVTEYVRHDAAP